MSTSQTDKKRIRRKTEYHVGCGLAGVYAGVLGPERKDGQQAWRSKSDVTDEAVNAVAQYLFENKIGVSFCYGGKKYRMSIAEVVDGGE